MDRVHDSVDSSGFEELLNEIEFATANMHAGKDGRSMDSLSVRPSFSAAVPRVDSAKQNTDDQSRSQRIEEIERSGLNVHSPVSHFATAEPEDFQMEHSTSMDLLEEAVLQEAAPNMASPSTQISPSSGRLLLRSTHNSFLLDHYEDSVIESASGHHFAKRDVAFQAKSIDSLLQEIAEECCGENDEFALEARLGVGLDCNLEKEGQIVSSTTSEPARTRMGCMIM
jgi:hypothetical protein